MNNKSYTATIEVAKPANEVFHAITQVPDWWSKDFEGNASKEGDEFMINHPGQHYSKQKLVELIPGKRLVWLVTDSKLNWIADNKEEWTGTKMIFDIIPGDKTVLQFIHEGLIPGMECYAMCEKGWDIVIKDWLLHLITVGTPSTEMNNAAEIRKANLDNISNSKNEDYHTTIIVTASANEAMKKISEINRWWKNDFRGSAAKLNDKFTVPFGDPSFVDFVVSEWLPGKRIAWKVTDCFLPWFKDKKEWMDTEIVFRLSQNESKTQIDFMHRGLHPDLECYEVCEKGWDGHLSTLAQFINEDKGLPG